MGWTKTIEGFSEWSGQVVTLGANLLVQSTVLIAAGLVLYRLLRRRGVAVQSAVLRTTLAMVLLCPLTALLMEASGIDGLTLHLPEPVIQHDAESPVTAPEPTTTSPSPPEAVDAADDPSLLMAGPAEGIVLPPIEPASAGLAVFEVAAAETQSPLAAPVAPMDAASAASGPVVHTVIELMLLYSGLAIVWLSVSLVLLTRLLVCYVRLSRLRRFDRPAGGLLTAECRSAAEEMGVAAPAIMVNPFITSPCLVGFVRPAILLPESEEMGRHARRQLIVHELAHLSRRDCLWNLLCRLASAVLFHQPLLWLLSRQIEDTSDEVCDDYVIRHAEDRRRYARQLVDLAERFVPHAPEVTVGVGVIAFKSSLGRRIQRILDTSRTLSVRVGVHAVIALAALGVCGALIAGTVRVSRADQQKEDSATTAAHDDVPTTQPAETSEQPASGLWELGGKVLAVIHDGDETQLVEQLGGMGPAAEVMAIREKLDLFGVEIDAIYASERGALLTTSQVKVKGDKTARKSIHVRVRKRGEQWKVQSVAALHAGETGGAVERFLKVYPDAKRLAAVVAAPPNDAAPAGKRYLDLRVLHRDNEEPLADVELTIRGLGGEQYEQTDKRGVCRIELPEKRPNWVQISAWKEGLVPLRYRPRGAIPSHYTLKMEPGSAIGGVVRNEQGEPIMADVKLRVSPHGENEVEPELRDVVVEADKQGHWRAEGLPTDLNGLRIELIHPDYIGIEAYGDQLPPVNRLRDMTAVLVMPTGVPLEGKVTDSEGKLIAGAKVTLKGSHGVRPSNPADPASPETDADGRFRLDKVRTGMVRLDVSAEGFVAAEREFSAREGAKPVTIELQRALALSGRVTDTSGNPIEEAHVYAWHNDWRGHPRDRTNAEGRFTLTGLRPGAWHLAVDKSKFSSVRQDVRIPTDGAPPELVLQLTPGVPVRGVVYGPDGKTPLVGAKVKQRGRGDSIEVDPQGRFELPDVTPAKWQLDITADGFAVHTEPFEVEAGRTPPEIKIVVSKRGGMLAGAVADSSRKLPLGGETVVAYPLEEPRGILEHYLKRGNLTEFREQNFHESPHFITETDAQGRYKLEHLAEGYYLVCVIREQGGNVWRERVRVREGKTKEGVDLDVAARGDGGKRLTGRLLEPDGRPVPNTSARVSMVRKRGSSSFGVKTDSEGRYFIKAGPDGFIRDKGEYKIEIMVKGYEPAKQTVRIDPEALPDGLDFTLKPEPPGGPITGSISGKVYMPDGKTPAARVMVAPYVKDRPWAGANASSTFGSHRYATKNSFQTMTDGEGTYVISKLRPGSYGVYVSARGAFGHGRRDQVPAEIAKLLPTMLDPMEVKGTETAKASDIVMTKGASLAGKVLDADTGEPIVNARIRLSEDHSRGLLGGLFGRPSHRSRLPFHSRPDSAEADEHGHYRIDGLPAMRFRLSVSANEYDDKQVEKVTVKSGQEKTVNVKLKPTQYGSVTGRVLLPDGQPAVGAEVRAYSTSTWVRTDDQGRYRIDRVPAGTRSVGARRAGFALTMIKRVKVQSGQDSSADLRMRVGGEITGRVTAADGKTPVDDALVCLTPAAYPPVHVRPEHQQHDPGFMFTHADENGNYRFEHVPGDRLQLFVHRDVSAHENHS